MTKIKKNDNVVVIQGSDRGKKGKVLFINSKTNRAIVEGVNVRKKFVRPSQDNPKGGVLKREYPLDVSNIMLFCDKCKKRVRITMKVTDKEKSRCCYKCGKSFD